MRSILADDILFHSSTCFQMEYVIMGYLKVKENDNKNDADHLQM